MKDRVAFDWFSVLTNLGVIAGLLLVAYEVRQGALQAEADASNAMITQLENSIKELALSPDLAEIYVNATANGVEALSPVEKFRLTKWEQARRTRILGQILQYERGFLERGAIMAMLPSLSSVEKGLWADLDIPPVRGNFADVIAPIREEMGLLDQ